MSHRSLEEGAEAESTEELGYRHAALVCSAIFLIAQAFLPRDGTAHPGLALLTSIANHELVPQACPQLHLMEGIFQMKGALPRCVKLTTKICHQK